MSYTQNTKFRIQKQQNLKSRMKNTRNKERETQDGKSIEMKNTVKAKNDKTA